MTWQTRTKIVVPVNFSENSVEAIRVVVPSHGHHSIKRMWLGPVAELVVSHVSCSILVLCRDDAE